MKKFALLLISSLFVCLISQGQANDQEVKRMIKREEAIATELKELSPPKQVSFIGELVIEDLKSLAEKKKSKEMKILEERVSEGILMVKNIITKEYEGANWRNRRRLARELNILKEVYIYKRFALKEPLPFDYINLFYLEMTGTELDNLWRARMLAMDYLEIFRRSAGERVFQLERPVEEIEKVERGIAMLIQVYSVRMYPDYAQHDLEKAMEIFQLNLGHQQDWIARQMARRINRELGLKIDVE